MPRYHYVILTRAAAGREAEFDAWYDDQHLGDVARVEGIVSARRFKVQWQQTTELEAPEWRSLAIYEIEADNPHEVMASISKVAGTEAMPISDALLRSGMIQLLAQAIKDG